MKILSIMPYSPVPPDFGGALREYYLLKSLASEHDVTVLTYGNHEQCLTLRNEFGELDHVYMLPEPWQRKYRRTAQLYSLCTNRSYFHLNNCSQQMQNTVYMLLATQNFDAVHCEFSVMGNLDFGEDILKILDTHNVEYKNFHRMWKKTDSTFRKWFYRREYEKVYKEEIQTLKNQNIIFSTSDNDREIIRKDVPDVPNYVVPNGVDTSYFTPSQTTEKEPYSMVFTGMMAYTPNYDGMLWFLDEIFPQIKEEKPSAKIYIVGKRPPAELKNRASDSVIVTGFVDDVRPYVWRSSVFVVPLRMGSGTRLKVVEALSMKKPVVSTSIGCEGIEVENGKSILINDAPKAFARSVIQLLEDRHLRRHLIDHGYELVHEKYDWSVVGERMLAAYDELLPEKQNKRELAFSR